jgi:hypothetical protein
MEKNKIYILIILLTAILLFGIGAICNQCGAITSATTETTSTTAGTSATNGTTSAETTAETTSPENTANRNPEISDINIPGGTMNISQQYEISASASDPDGDDLAYEWTVSDGSIDNTAANPIKWTTPAVAGSYTITLKVTDDKGGKATKSKNISVEIAVVNLNVPKVTTEGGYIEKGGKINSGGGLFAGDSASGSGYIGDKPVSGYVSFDITGLNGKIIDNTVLTFNLNEIYGVPDPAFGGIWVGIVDWGAEALVLSDFSLPQVGIQLFDMSGDGNIACDTTTLKTQLQNAIDDGKSRFQIRISCPGIESNLNNTWDGWSYLQAGINLNIDYH